MRLVENYVIEKQMSSNNSIIDNIITQIKNFTFQTGSSNTSLNLKEKVTVYLEQLKLMIYESTKHHYKNNLNFLKIHNVSNI